MQESNLIASKLLSDAGLHVRMNSPPESATLMTHAQPGFCQAPNSPSSPTTEASPAASPTSANDLPISMPAEIRGSPSECGGNHLTPSMSRASSAGPSGFLATPLSADSLPPPPMVIPSPSAGLCAMSVLLHLACRTHVGVAHKYFRWSVSYCTAGRVGTNTMHSTMMCCGPIRPPVAFSSRCSSECR